MHTLRGLRGLMIGLLVLVVWGIGVPQTASAQIGTGSCTGTDACNENSDSIGDNSCNGFHACAPNTGSIGDGSCNGFDACERNSGSIGNNSCNGDSACFLLNSRASIPGRAAGYPNGSPTDPDERH